MQSTSPEQLYQTIPTSSCPKTGAHFATTLRNFAPPPSNQFSSAVFRIRLPRTSGYRASTPRRRDVFADAAAEVRALMTDQSGSGMAQVMRTMVERYSGTWITLEQVYEVACVHGVPLSPFKPWVLYTCKLTFPRAELLGDVPWGTALPYFDMSSHSESHEAMFRVAAEFLYHVSALP